VRIPTMQAKPTNWQTLLEMHLQWYPLMQLRDVYKLIFQGVMGAEHLMPSREEYTRYLMDEFQPLVPDPAERLLEPLRPDGALYRLNLRPLKARQLGLDRLISYLLDTADVIKGDRAELLAAWAEFTQLCVQGQFHQYDPASIEQFSQWLEQVEYPAIHHSEVYNREYQPAYRLIARQFIQELGLEEWSE
jgi:hypothetical protein